MEGLGQPGPEAVVLDSSHLDAMARTQLAGQREGPDGRMSLVRRAQEESRQRGRGHVLCPM